MQFTPSPTNEELLAGISLYAEEIATLRVEVARLRAALEVVHRETVGDPHHMLAGVADIARAALEGAR